MVCSANSGTGRDVFVQVIDLTWKNWQARRGQQLPRLLSDNAYSKIRNILTTAGSASGLEMVREG